MAEVSSHPAVRVETLPDVYRALARVMGKGSAAPDAIIVDADELMPEEFEFFALLANHKPDVPVHVYGDESARARAITARLQKARDTQAGIIFPNRARQGAETDEIGIEPHSPLKSEISNLKSSDPIVESANDEIHSIDNRHSTIGNQSEPRAQTTGHSLHPLPLGEGRGEGYLNRARQEAETDEIGIEPRSPLKSEISNLKSSDANVENANDEIHSIDNRHSTIDNQSEPRATGLPSSSDNAQIDSDLSPARVPWKQYDSRPQRRPPGTPLHTFLAEPRHDEAPSASQHAGADLNIPSSEQDAIHYVGEVSDSQGNRSQLPPINESNPPSKPSVEHRAADAPIPHTANEPQFKPVADHDLDRYAPLLTPEELDALMFSEDEFAATAAEERRHLLADDAASDLP